MTNGLGASIGVIAAQEVVNYFTQNQTFFGGWPTAWYVFAGYALVIAVLFAVVFKEKRLDYG
jgi:NHS family nucleoside permease-like MFS transporter/NHS family xanthosine MFS transporter